MSRLLLSLSLALLCSLVVLTPTSAQLNQLTTSTLYDFESPVTYYTYNPPITAVQPWTWLTGAGGVASQGSPFDPPGNNQPPHNIQYAFIQTTVNTGRTSYMSAVLTGLSTTATYYVTFYIGVRLGGSTGEITPNITASTVYLRYGSQLLWQSVNNISDSNGYLFVQTAVFTPATTSASFNFSVVSQTTDDHSILIDAVTINPTVTPPNATLSVGVTSTFDNPAIAGTYDYTTPVSTIQPWTWTQGGRAMVGSPFDPPPPTNPPSGNQYAFIQTSPNAAAINTSTMSAVCTGLSRTQSYQISYYWAVRRATAGSEPEGGNVTQSQLSVLVDGVAVYVSPQNLTDVGGWALVQTPPFVPSLSNNGSSVITFLVTATSNHDHTLLLDNVTVSLNSSSVIAPASPSSSSSSSSGASAAVSSSGSSSSGAVRASSSSSSSAAVSSSSTSTGGGVVVVTPSSSSSSAAVSQSSSSSSAAAAQSSSAATSSSSSAASRPSSSSTAAAVTVTSSSSPSSSAARAASSSASSSSSSTATPPVAAYTSSSSSSDSSSSSAVYITSIPAPITITNAAAAAAHSHLSSVLSVVLAALLAVLAL